jgi:transposase
MENCGGAHYWARELRRLGHEVRLMAPQFVAPYRKNDKSDGNDAEAICEAVGRPDKRFVPVQDEQQQALLALHRTRELLVGERTALINQTRGLLAEYGIVVAQRPARLRAALPEVLEDGENGLPSLAREVFADIYDRLRELERRLGEYDRRIEWLAQQDASARALMQLDGVGQLTATALIASVADAQVFDKGRQFACNGSPKAEHKQPGSQAAASANTKGIAQSPRGRDGGNAATCRAAGG